MILDQFYIFYTGLIFKIICTSNIEDQVSKKSKSRAKPSIKKIVKNSTKQHIMERFIAYGGRYDNCISHFDIPTRASNIFAVGSCINISEIVNAALQALDDSKQMSKFRDRIDICIFSNESYQEEGMKLLATFWHKGYKATADFRNKKLKDMFDFCTINSIRFLIILKDEKDNDFDVRSKVRIKDFKNKTEHNIDIQNIIDYFDHRLASKNSKDKSD